MTAVPMSTPLAPDSTRSQLWRKSLAVSRMHLTDPVTPTVLPAALLGLVFTITLVVWSMIPGDGGEGWGEMSVYCFLAGIAALAVTRALPFSLGMGSSRRAFVLGTLLTEVALTAGWGLALFVLQRVEKASDGWGQQLHFFWWSWYARSPWPADLLFLVTSLAACSTLGALLAAVWVRWDRLALLVGGPVTLLVLGGAAIAATYLHWWGAVVEWIGGRTPLDAAGLCAVAVVVLVALQYAALRRVRA